MQNEEHINIETLSEFIDWTDELRHEICLFRGLPNRIHSIEASAWRRLTGEQDSNNIDKLIELNKDLINDACDRRFHIKDHGELSDLEILAELQHFRASTFLIDFTYSAQVALWFACQQRFKDPHNPKELSDGKVSVVFVNPDRIKKVTPELLQQDISVFFETDTDGRTSLYWWEPGEINSRIPPQHSVFLFGADRVIKPDSERIIEAHVKRTILDSIEGFSQTTESTLFPDFDGFIQQRTQDRPYVSKDFERIRAAGYRAYQQEEFEKAISYFDEIIDQDPTDADVNYWRGESKHSLNQIKEAIDDYNVTIRLKDNDMNYYYSRGMAWRKLNEYGKAKEDLETALTMANKKGNTYLINDIKIILSDIAFHIDQVDKWTASEFKKLVPEDIREHYDSRKGDKELYKLGADLQSLIQKKGWTLERRFGRTYFVFCYGRRRLFGVNLFNNPRLAIWRTGTDKSKYSDIEHKLTDYSVHNQLLFPRGTKVEDIKDVLEKLYNDNQNDDYIQRDLFEMFDLQIET